MEARRKHPIQMESCVKMKATIFKIERLNTHNGPGFRTVIYFKGCPLHCSWCHNPEGINNKKQVWVNDAKCIGCGTCVDSCPIVAINFTREKINIKQEVCTGCQSCAQVCPSQAIEIIGQDYTIDALMHIILQDKFLFEISGGGLTVTGGEPGLYANFVAKLFKQCKAHGIQTAFDTSGCISTRHLEKLVEVTDILFVDLKICDNEKSMQHTGLNTEQIKDNLKWLQKQTINPNLQLEFRTPLVPGITDDLENLDTFARQVLAVFPKSKWELCLFNDLCADKYQKLNLNWNFHNKKHTLR